MRRLAFVLAALAATLIMAVPVGASPAETGDGRVCVKANIINYVVCVYYE